MSMELDGRFFRRCLHHQQRQQLFDGPWLHVLGDYSQTAITPEVSVERFFRQRIRALLTEREGHDDPVVAMDAGAGAAMTMLKLALEFPDEAKDGRLVLGAINAKFDPRTYLRLAGDDIKRRNVFEPGSVSQDELRNFLLAVQLTKDFGDLLYEIPGDFSALHCLDNDSTNPIDLVGAVDILHERRSVTPWSVIPELHIRRLGALVSDRGIYMVHDEDSVKSYGFMRRSQRAQCVAGIQEAQAALSDVYGLERVTHVEAGDLAGEPLCYRIFKAPEASPIALGQLAAAVVQ